MHLLIWLLRCCLLLLNVTFNQMDFVNFDLCHLYKMIEAPNIIISPTSCEWVGVFASRCLVAVHNISVHVDHLSTSRRDQVDPRFKILCRMYERKNQPKVG